MKKKIPFRCFQQSLEKKRERKIPSNGTKHMLVSGHCDFEIIHCNPKHLLRAVILIKNVDVFHYAPLFQLSAVQFCSLIQYAAVEWRPTRRNQTSVLEAGWLQSKS